MKTIFASAIIGEYPIRVEMRNKNNFRVSYGQEVTDELTYTEAAHKLGECVFHSIACAGDMDSAAAPRRRRTYARLYVGSRHNGLGREVFRSVETPNEKTHGKRYAYTIGPFRTVAGAQYMAQHGHNNPQLQTVAAAEQASRVAKRAGSLSAT